MTAVRLKSYSELSFENVKKRFEEFSKKFEEFFRSTKISPTLQKDAVNQKTHRTCINQWKTSGLYLYNLLITSFTFETYK